MLLHTEQSPLHGEDNTSSAEYSAVVNAILIERHSCDSRHKGTVITVCTGTQEGDEATPKQIEGVPAPRAQLTRRCRRCKSICMQVEI
jgi:hypothetical protein